MRVVRPGWRFYGMRFFENARAHVAGGGHAVVRVHDDTRWVLWMPCEDGAISELSAWSLLDLDLGGFDEATEGEGAGMAFIELPEEVHGTVERWCERDSVYATSTVEEDLDCRACGMCCRDNEVLLDDDDLGRWRDANRPELSDDSCVRKVGERLALRVLSGGDCVHLRGNDCGIYELRPGNCAAFPAGSECCLSARAPLRSASPEGT